MPMTPTAPLSPIPRQQSDGIQIKPAHHAWDYCEGLQYDSPTKISKTDTTLGGCECKNEWSSEYGTYHGCSLSPMGKDTFKFMERLDDFATIPWCKVKNNSCVPKSPAVRGGINIPYRLQSSGLEKNREEFDACFNSSGTEITADDESNELYLCLKREPVKSAPRNRIISNIYIAHDNECPANMDIVSRDSSLDGSLNQFSGGYVMLLCVERNVPLNPDDSSQKGALDALDDVIVSGGNTSVLSCPCSYHTANHSKFSKKDQYDFPNEIMLNLQQIPKTPISRNSGRPWYIFLCTHKYIDVVVQETITMEENERVVREAENLVRHRNATPTKNDDIVVFVFLIYHTIHNEHLWKRYFESAPESLRDSWRIVVHYKESLVDDSWKASAEHIDHTNKAFKPGPWSEKMIKEGKMIVVPKHMLVRTSYCHTSLVEAVLTSLDVALEHNQNEFGGRVKELVLVSADSIPIRSFASVNFLLLLLLFLFFLFFYSDIYYAHRIIYRLCSTA